MKKVDNCVKLFSRVIYSSCRCLYLEVGLRGFGVCCTIVVKCWRSVPKEQVKGTVLRARPCVRFFILRRNVFEN